jgi:hypothetical protein
MSFDANAKSSNNRIHPVRHELECKRLAGFAPGKPRHMVIPVSYPSERSGFVYTHGVAATHSSKVEFIYDGCATTEMDKMMVVFNFLADDHKSGNLVKPFQLIQYKEDYFASMALPEEVNAAFLDTHATACDRDVQLMVIVPYDHRPAGGFQLMMELDIFLHMMVSTHRVVVSSLDIFGECGSKHQGSENLLRCAGCKQVAYCSRDCQHVDWKNHKVICKRL